MATILSKLSGSQPTVRTRIPGKLSTKEDLNQGRVVSGYVSKSPISPLCYGFGSLLQHIEEKIKGRNQQAATARAIITEGIPWRRRSGYTRYLIVDIEQFIQNAERALRTEAQTTQVDASPPLDQHFTLEFTWQFYHVIIFCTVGDTASRPGTEQLWQVLPFLRCMDVDWSFPPEPILLNPDNTASGSTPAWPPNRDLFWKAGDDPLMMAAEPLRNTWAGLALTVAQLGRQGCLRLAKVQDCPTAKGANNTFVCTVNPTSK